MTNNAVSQRWRFTVWESALLVPSKAIDFTWLIDA